MDGESISLITNKLFIDITPLKAKVINLDKKNLEVIKDCLTILFLFNSCRKREKKKREVRVYKNVKN